MAFTSPCRSPIRVEAFQRIRLPHLFRKYGDAGAEERSVGGGLGLSICKGLVEAQGGRIWATSGGAGQGTQFTFTIPVTEEGGR